MKKEQERKGKKDPKAKISGKKTSKGKNAKPKKRTKDELDDVELDDDLDDELDDDDPDDDFDRIRKRDKKKKRKMGKRTKIAVAVLVIIVVLMIGLWGMHSSKSYLTVSDVVNNKDKYLGDHIEVKGTVGKDSLDPTNKTFNLTDGKIDLLVNYNGSLPTNFEEGKEVVVTGTLRDDVNFGLVVDAKEIEVGCASKY